MTETEPRSDRNLEPAANACPSPRIRHEMVVVVGRQRQLERRHQAAAELADRLEQRAFQALTEDRARVRAFLDQRVEVLKQAEALAEQLRDVAMQATRLKADLLDSGSTAH